MDNEGFHLSSSGGRGDELAGEVAEERTDEYGLRRRTKGRTSKVISDDFQARVTSKEHEERKDIPKKSKTKPGRAQKLEVTSRQLRHGAVVELTHDHKKSLSQRMKRSILQKRSIFDVQIDRKPSKSVFQPLRRSSSIKLEKPKLPEDEPIVVRTSILEKKGWTTADTIRDEEGYIIFALRDFLIYSIFLLLIWMITFGPRDPAFNYYANIISDVMTKTNFQVKIGDHNVTGNFENVRAINQIYGMINIFAEIYQDGKILFENLPVGTVSIRQVRVRKDTCTSAPMFKDLYKTCYDYYQEDTEFKEPYGNSSLLAWKYTPSQGGLSYGRVSNYGSGGYRFEFVSDKEYNRYKFKEMIRLNWITKGTRAVILDMTLFAPSTNLFLTIKLIYEVLPTGGVKTKSYFSTLKLFVYLTVWDLFTMSCQFMFIGFTVYFTFEESTQMWVLKEEYLANWWNVLDIIVISLSYITSFFGILRFIHILFSLGGELEKINTTEHPNFDTFILYENLNIISSSFLIFVCCLKLFKFTSLYKSVTLIIGALGQVVTELFMVIYMTVILITGFALCALVLFGAHVTSFRNFSNSFYSLFSIFAGNLNYYEECEYAYPIAAPIFFAVYILVAGVMFISVYVALIVYGYHQADVALQLRPDTPFLSDLVWGFFMEILVFFRMHDTINNIKMKKILHQNNEDYDSFVRILKRRGWQGLELQLFLKTNGVERGEPINLEQLSELYNEFCLRNSLFVEVEDHNAIHIQLEKVEKLFEFCDQTIVDIMTKIDHLANHIIPNDSTKRRFRIDSNVEVSE